MHPFASYAPNQHESFTLHPPYNPTDQNIFDTFAYSSSDAVPYLSTPNWEYYHTAVQDVSDTGTEYPYLSSLQFPDLPLHTPVPRPAQPSLLLPDPSPANVALSYSPEGPTPFCDLNTILNSTDLFAGLFPDVEYCDFPVPVPVPVPQPAPTGVAPQMLALNMTESYSGASLSPRRSRVARVHPTLGISGFSPSDPDDLSSHEKKRLYVECLEHYVQYLHQLLAYLNVPPIPLERVSSYRGLTSRSMRTILLTLGRSADMIHALTVEEANKVSLCTYATRYSKPRL
ncbi:hypothetical protein FB451DRAFT_538458 [Mycena latifolia]|nr:hypothetical protein FB451DRAFT_538458 [Mycena latifolia]